jgi:hypothetical protein
METSEIWRDVPGYEGKYQISIATKECHCRSLNYRHTGKPTVLKNRAVLRNRCYRAYWQLCKNGNCITRQIAKWVALTFPELVENEYFEGAQIDHKDTDSMNNQPSNLRWTTPKENSNNPLSKVHLREAIKSGKVRGWKSKGEVSSLPPITGA